MSNGSWWLLIVVFAPLSLLSIGGGQSIVAAMDQQVVHVYGWLTQTEFIDLFAISRAAPGPGSLLVTLIGWKVAGIPGALIASAALFLPSSVLAYGVTRLWHRHRGRPLRRAGQAQALIRQLARFQRVTEVGRASSLPANSQAGSLRYLDETLRAHGPPLHQP